MKLDRRAHVVERQVDELSVANEEAWITENKYM